MNADQKTSDIEGCAKDYMNLCSYYEYENVGQICKQISGNLIINTFEYHYSIVKKESFFNNEPVK